MESQDPATHSSQPALAKARRTFSVSPDCSVSKRHDGGFGQRVPSWSWIGTWRLR